MQQYTELAFQGRFQEARRVRDSLDPVRQALSGSRAPGTPHAQQKYWQELLGQVGGPVRRPLLPLAESERATIRHAFERSFSSSEISDHRLIVCRSTLRPWIPSSLRTHFLQLPHL